MKPLNHPAKKKAVNNFIGMYALSILIVLLSSYFLFSSPVKIQTAELREYNELKAQHSSLLDKTTKITTHISELAEIETAVNEYSNSALDSLNSKYQQQFNDALAGLKKDSANKTFPLLYQDLNNFIVACNAILFYSRNNSDLRHRTNSSLGMNTSSKNKIESPGGENTAQLFLLRKEKERLQGENSDLKSKLTACENKPLVTGSDNQQVKTLTTQVQTLNTTVRTLENDRDNYKGQVAKKNDEIKIKDDIIRNAGTTKKAETVFVCNDQEQAKLLYQAAEQIMRKADSEKKERKQGAYLGARVILVSIQSTYPDKDKLNQRLRDINAVLSQKPDNF